MADIVINLGSVTIKDHAANSGKLTQQQLQDWLDEHFDPANAGGDYQNRMRRAVRLVGIRNIQEQAGASTNHKLRMAAPITDSDIIEEAE